MAITFVQSNSALNASVAYSTKNTAGNFLVAVFRGSTSSATPTDNAGSVGGSTNNTWHLAIGEANGVSGINIWFAPNCQGTTSPVTVNTHSSQSQAVIAEYSGLALTVGTVFSNITAGNTGTGNPYNVAAVSTSTVNALLIGGVANETANTRTNTPTGGFANVNNANENCYMMSQIPTSLGTFTLGGSYAGAAVNWEAAVAVFNAPVASAPAGPTWMQYGFGF